MIVRTWRASAHAANRAAYPSHFHGAVVPALQAIAGFRGAVLLQREQGTEVEFLVLTRWESLAAIAAFAGDDVARAVVEPEAMAALTAFDRTAQHYEVVEERAFG